METGFMVDSEKEQQIKELTSFMMHKHYCENDLESVITLMDNSFSWIGAGEEEYADGAETVAGLFRQFSGKVPACIISNEEYTVINPVPDIFVCSGRLWIRTDPKTGICLRVHQRVTGVFRWNGEMFRCCHIHISNPYSEMVEGDVGFPSKLAKQSYEYLQEQIAVQKKLIQEQTDTLVRMSFEDSLTGLYNRNKFNQVMDADAGGTKSSAPLGFAYFDLNGLKEVNDRQGHNAGDNLIFRTANHIRKVFDGKAYRIGGDEFIVIDRELDESQFRAGIAAVCNSMEQDGISISAGISWRSRNCNVMEQFDEADKLMYEAKHQYYSCKDRDRRRGYRHHMKK